MKVIKEVCGLAMLIEPIQQRAFNDVTKEGGRKKAGHFVIPRTPTRVQVQGEKLLHEDPPNGLAT